MGQFVLIALATFVSEDLTCVATGALIAAGKLGFGPGVLSCLFGIYAGDLLLYFAGRVLGRPILNWRPLRKVLSVEKLDRASEWLAKRGAGVVILSRFTPGLRLPTYVAAGILKTRVWTFALYFLAAAAIWTPVLVGASAILGKSLPRAVFIGPAFLLVGTPCRRLAFDWQARRRALGWLRRRTRWEFWPPWLAYLPLTPYLAYLGIKYRSMTVFTAANPGIPSGGFVGESKSAILGQLSNVPDFAVLRAGASVQSRCDAVHTFLAGHELSYPVVLKPDVGERGSGVTIARSDQDVRTYFEAGPADTIAQRYVAGPEFGIFYYRYPGELRGRISSITQKRFPRVEGDGVSTIEELVLRDERAVCLADLYLARFGGSAQQVPAAGEQISLAEIGSHCRGAIFLNAAELETDALAAAVDASAKSHPGFFFGRFDVRSASIADLQAGRFAVLELNGVTGEATHIYDPSVSLVEAYRVMFRQWRIAFAIGAWNRDRGEQVMGIRELVAGGLAAGRKQG